MDAKQLRKKAKELEIENYGELGLEELAEAVAEASGEDVEVEVPEEEEVEEDEDEEDEEDEDEEDDDHEAEVIQMPKRTGTRKRTSAAKRSPRKSAAKKAPVKKTARKSTARRDAGRARKSRPASRKSAPARKAPASKKRGAAPKPAREYEGPNPFRPGCNNWHVTEALQKGGKRKTLVSKLLPKMKYNPRINVRNFDAEGETFKRIDAVSYFLEKNGWDRERSGKGEDAFVKCTPPRSR
jgi:hypothetical protein